MYQRLKREKHGGIKEWIKLWMRKAGSIYYGLKKNKREVGARREGKG